MLGVIALAVSAASVAIVTEKTPFHRNSKYAATLLYRSGDATPEDPAIVRLESKSAKLTVEFSLVQFRVQVPSTARVRGSVVGVQHDHVWYRAFVPSEARARLGGYQGLNRWKNDTRRPVEVQLTGFVHAGGESWTLQFANTDGSGGLVLTLNTEEQDKMVMAAHPLHGNSHAHDASCVQHSLYEHDTEHGKLTGSPRHRRGDRVSNKHTECGFFLDGDSYYYNQWKGGCLPAWSSATCEAKQLSRVTVKMITTMHHVDELYRREANLAGALTFAVVGTHVFTSAGEGVPDFGSADAEGVILGYEAWLATGHSLTYTDGKWVSDTHDIRGLGQPKAMDACLNHLFTHTDVGGGVLGVAAISGFAATHGWFIQPNGNFGSTDQGLGSAFVNSGFSTTLSAYGIVPPWKTTTVAAHEIAHNFGAKHDCCMMTCDSGRVAAGTEQICPSEPSEPQRTIDHGGVTYQFDPSADRASCVPRGSNTTNFQAGYLMYPFVSSQRDSEYGQIFSSCSKAEIENTLASSGDRLTIPNPCENGGGCCDDFNNLKLANTKCRDADHAAPCSAPAVCDGAHPECPNNAFLADDTPCDVDVDDPDNHGICHSGVCSHIHALWCATHYGSMRACVVPGMECVRSCAQSIDGKCVYGTRLCEGVDNVRQIFSDHGNWGNMLYWLGDHDTCDIAPVGTPCVIGGTIDGSCLQSGECQSCGSEGCRPNIVYGTDAINYCSGVSCSNAGNCSSGERSYTCACNTGYTGSNCEIDVNECDGSSICGGTGTCINTYGAYTCNCSATENVQGICTKCSDANACSALGSCNVNYFDSNNDAADGCEQGCPAVGNGTCTACSDNATCTTITCDVNHFDTNSNATDGCEATCAAAANATFCEACTTALASGCTSLGECNANHFDTNGNATDGCEATCAAASNATSCETCATALASGCTSLGECNANYFDTNGNAADGCEATCAAAANAASCKTCTTAVAAGCTALGDCDTNYFDTNGNAVDGCEATCAAVANAVSCNTCTTAATSGCTSLGPCVAGFVDTNKDAADGCEAPCTAPANAVSCERCTTADASGCTSLGPCHASFFDMNKNAADGCEAPCAAPANAVSCNTCTTADAFGCTSLGPCNATFFDKNKNAADGCEASKIFMEFNFLECVLLGTSLFLFLVILIIALCHCCCGGSGKASSNTVHPAKVRRGSKSIKVQPNRRQSFSDDDAWNLA